MVVIALSIGITLTLFVLLAISMANLRMFPHLQISSSQIKHPINYPAVSILVPARNEEDTIGQTVRLLLNQDYPIFEVIVLDDESEDCTFTVAQSTAAGDSRFRILRGVELPNGWVGKNWACHQLASEAQYDLLVFTDADVQWQPGALRAVVDEAIRNEVDSLTVWPTQKSVTFAERLIVPLMAFSIHAYLPIWLVHNTSHSSAAAANGQCLVFHRDCYNAVGGHAAVCNTVLEDVKLARLVKAKGMSLRMAEADQLLTCRMYSGFKAVVSGFAKNILAGHSGRISLLLASGIFHNLLFVLPWVWLLWGFLAPIPGWPIWPVIMATLGVSIRGITAYTSRQSISDSIWLPVSVLLMTFIAYRAVSMSIRNVGPVWKGRQLIADNTSRAP